MFVTYLFLIMSREKMIEQHNEYIGEASMSVGEVPFFMTV